MIKAFPKSTIVARNGCTPGVQSSYMIMCMDLSVDPDVDLIFMEYTLNDGHDDRVYGNRIVKNMERLVRRLLALKRRPAVVFVHHVTHYQAHYPEGHPKYEGNFRPFYETSEDVQGSLAQYYDAQSLSLRTALYRVSAHKELPGFLWEEVMADFHAGDLGHKVLTDLAVYMVQQVALDLLMQPYGAVDEEVIDEPLPRPMYKGNLPPNSPMCILYERFQSLVVNNTGWDYVNEGTDVKPKPGFVALQPGSTLRVRLDTDRSGSADRSESVHVFFHHLRSYERMGVAKFSCVARCSCDAVVVDANITERVSQLYLAEMVVTQDKECEVEITVLGTTSSGQHKFKVAGVVVSDTAGNPTGVYSMGGNNQVFGLLQHTGDDAQLVLASGDVNGP